MLSPNPAAGSETEQVVEARLSPEEFIHSAICLIADLHNDLDQEFKALLARSCPDNDFDRTLENLKGSRLELFKKKLGETARQLATRQPGLLAALQAVEGEGVDLSHLDQHGQTQIIESTTTLRFAVTTLGVFTVTAGMGEHRFHPLGPIAQVMNKEGRVRQCLSTLERLRCVLLNVERTFAEKVLSDAELPEV